MEKWCKKCGSIRPGIYCWVCGGKVMSIEVKCPGCGEKISALNKFCENCGRPVQDVVKEYLEKGGEEDDKGKDESGKGNKGSGEV